MKVVKLLLIFSVILTLTSCATILSGRKQKINISTSSGKPVEVEVDNRVYTVPAIIEVERENKDKVLRVLNKNCQQRQVLLSKKVNPVFFVNLLSGGAFGSTTDYATDAMWKYDDNIDIRCN